MNWLTSTPSIVVTVRHKVARPTAGELLPSELAGVFEGYIGNDLQIASGTTRRPRRRGSR